MRPPASPTPRAKLPVRAACALRGLFCCVCSGHAGRRQAELHGEGGKQPVLLSENLRPRGSFANARVLEGSKRPNDVRKCPVTSARRGLLAAGGS